jgi:hypothetical protein
MAHHNALKWRCVNPDCKWSIAATVALPGEPTPRCICGDSMQKIAPAPAMKYLDFLRQEPFLMEARAVEEE